MRRLAWDLQRVAPDLRLALAWRLEVGGAGPGGAGLQVVVAVGRQEARRQHQMIGSRPIWIDCHRPADGRHLVWVAGRRARRPLLLALLLLLLLDEVLKLEADSVSWLARAGCHRVRTGIEVASSPRLSHRAQLADPLAHFLLHLISPAADPLAHLSQVTLN